MVFKNVFKCSISRYTAPNKNLHHLYHTVEHDPAELLHDVLDKDLLLPDVEIVAEQTTQESSWTYSSPRIQAGSAAANFSGNFFSGIKHMPGRCSLLIIAGVLQLNDCILNADSRQSELPSTFKIDAINNIRVIIVRNIL